MSAPEIGLPFVYMKGWDGHRDIVERIEAIIDGPNDHGYNWVRNSNNGEGWIRYDPSSDRWEDVDNADNLAAGTEQNAVVQPPIPAKSPSKHRPPARGRRER